MVGCGLVGVDVGGGVCPVLVLPVGHSPRVGSQLAGAGFPGSTVGWHPAKISTAASIVTEAFIVTS